MKEILSKSSYFLVFSGFVSWLLFGLNIYEKLVNIQEEYHVECQKGLENIKLSENLLLDEVDKFRKREFREIGLYKKYIKWIFNS